MDAVIHHEEREKNYVRPQNAWKKLKASQSIGRTVYIYGVSGTGKTSLVKEFLARKKYEYYSASEPAPEKLCAANENGGIVVIDDLQLLADEEKQRYFSIISRLDSLPHVWLILISRAPVLKWLNPLFASRLITVVLEEDLALNDVSEYTEFFRQRGITPLPSTIRKIEKEDGFFPVFLGFVATSLLQIPDNGCGRSEKEESDAFKTAKWLSWNYYETRVLEKWDADLQQFIMDLSIVECFDLDMAKRITRKSDVGQYIRRVQELGNFIVESYKENTVVYSIRAPLRLLLLHKWLQQKASKSYIDELYNSAGAGFELKGKYVEALEMYTHSGNDAGISRILIENANRHPGCGYYWNMRQYYFALPENVILQNPDLIAAMSMIYSIMMNDAESDRWYEKLKKRYENAVGAERKNIKARLLYLDMALPHRSTSSMMDLLKKTAAFLTADKGTMTEMSVTNAQPSILNGGKDFCEWSRHDHAVAAALGGAVELVLGKMGRGLINTALAESLFEKGGENHEITSLAEKGRLQAESSGKLEIVFAAVGVLSRLWIINGKLSDALAMLDSFHGKLMAEAPHIVGNSIALRIRCLLYLGINSEILEWMEDAPDEDKEFCTLERLKYMIKLRIYIAMGQYEKAYRLCQKMLYFSQTRERVYIHIEVLALLAVVEKRLGRKNWVSTLQKAVSQAESYHFVRILTKEGAAVYRLLCSPNIKWSDPEYKKQVIAECRRMAERYPAYLKEKQSGNVALSDKAIEILRMQSEGMSVADIAETLYLSISGVKYYNRDTYQKLGVNGKAAAITEARNRGLL